jgi:hypothetical protein
MSTSPRAWRETEPGVHKLYEDGSVIARVNASGAGPDGNGFVVARVGTILLPGHFPSAPVAYGAVWMFLRDPVQWLTDRAYWCRVVGNMELSPAEIQQAQRFGVDFTEL